MKFEIQVLFPIWTNEKSKELKIWFSVRPNEELEPYKFNTKEEAELILKEQFPFISWEEKELLKLWRIAMKMKLVGEVYRNSKVKMVENWKEYYKRTGEEL